jgi:hypothetical protein
MIFQLVALYGAARNATSRNDLAFSGEAALSRSGEYATSAPGQLEPVTGIPQSAT